MQRISLVRIIPRIIKTMWNITLSSLLRQVPTVKMMTCCIYCKHSFTCTSAFVCQSLPALADSIRVSLYSKLILWGLCEFTASKFYFGLSSSTITVLRSNLNLKIIIVDTIIRKSYYGFPLWISLWEKTCHKVRMHQVAQLALSYQCS